MDIKQHLRSCSPAYFISLGQKKLTKIKKKRKNKQLFNFSTLICAYTLDCFAVN